MRARLRIKKDKRQSIPFAVTSISTTRGQLCVKGQRSQTPGKQGHWRWRAGSGCSPLPSRRPSAVPPSSRRHLKTSSLARTFSPYAALRRERSGAVTSGHPSTLPIGLEDTEPRSWVTDGGRQNRGPIPTQWQSCQVLLSH